jgi:hypothetical protein
MAAPLGEWESGVSLPPEDSKVVAIHACLTHLEEVLYFHCRSYPFWTRLYIPRTNKVSKVNYVVPKWPVYYNAIGETPGYPIQASKIFCSGHCFLPDGRLLVAGGELNNPYPDSYEPIAPDRGLRYSFIYDPEGGSESWSITGTFAEPHIMQDGRWYPTLTLLHDGTVLAMAGLTDIVVPVSDGFTVLENRTPEVYTYFGSTQGWKPNNDPAAMLPFDIYYSYPDAQVIPIGPMKGRVFYGNTQLLPPSYTEAGYSQIYDPFSSGLTLYWEAVSNRRETPSQGSSGVLLPIRKSPNIKAQCIIAGGWWVEPLKRIDIIDLDYINGPPMWTNDIAKMTYARVNLNAVILPDRSLLIIGGDNEAGSVLVPELLDTDTMTWISNNLPPMPVGRNYHSIAILLPDARVLLGGGRVINGGDVEDDTERQLSVFKPGYLMDGDRPIITNASVEITYEETFDITLDGSYPVDSIALMKPGAVTHGNNMDQRYIELEFTQPGFPNSYSLVAPDRYKAPPGYYMLFVLKDKSQSNSGESKIPSVAKFVKLMMNS